ncbi:unnamed protein product [Lactuca virosa]|uniref:Uncharacterized protein n=1 Tax=Lactuca virosa TaxID=75947 RepID=A0AAU9N8E7_9ASTR|nr:unnamed protein product [Lactuca virosa]
MLSYQISKNPNCSSFPTSYALSAVAAPQHIVDPTTTNKDEVWQLMMKIQTTNLHLVPLIDQYPEPLEMLVQTPNNSVLSTTFSSLFVVSMEWLSLTGSTVVFNKTTKVVTFQLMNLKIKKLTRKQFAQIMKLPVSGTFYEVSTDQVLHMFNEMRESTNSYWNKSL